MRDVGERENPPRLCPAEALDPADQVAGGNMTRDRFPMQGDQGGELGDADRRAAGKGSRQGLVEGGGIRGQGGALDGHLSLGR